MGRLFGFVEKESLIQLSLQKILCILPSSKEIPFTNEKHH